MNLKKKTKLFSSAQEQVSERSGRIGRQWLDTKELLERRMTQHLRLKHTRGGNHEPVERNTLQVKYFVASIPKTDRWQLRHNDDCHKSE